MKKYEFHKSELFLIITLGLISLGVFWNSYLLFQEDYNLSSPGFIPFILSIILILVSLNLLVRFILNKKRPEEVPLIEEQQVFFFINRKIVVVITTFIGFIILTQVIGFYIASLIFMFLSIGYLSKGQFIASIKYSIFFILFIWIIFGSIFKAIIK